MRWHNRDNKLNRRRSRKEMGKPFKRKAEKDSNMEKKLSKFKKKLKQVEQQENLTEDMDYDDYQ